MQRGVPSRRCCSHWLGDIGEPVVSAIAQSDLVDAVYDDLVVLAIVRGSCMLKHPGSLQASCNMRAANYAGRARPV